MTKYATDLDIVFLRFASSSESCCVGHNTDWVGKYQFTSISSQPPDLAQPLVLFSLMCMWTGCNGDNLNHIPQVTFIFSSTGNSFPSTCSTLCILFIFHCVHSEDHRCQCVWTESIVFRMATDWLIADPVQGALHTKQSMIIWLAVLNLFLRLPSFEPRQPRDVTHKCYRSSPKHFLKLNNLSLIMLHDKMVSFVDNKNMLIESQE